MQNKLFVGSLPWQTTDTELSTLFAEAGTVVSAEVIKDRATGQSKGFAFVVMSTDAEAQKAIELFHGRELEGRPMVVNIARPKEDRPPRYSQGGGDRPRFNDRGPSRNYDSFRKAA